MRLLPVMTRRYRWLHRTVDDAAAVLDVTIVNAGSAEYHARQFVRIVTGERWDD